jgi:hypothetical protein
MDEEGIRKAIHATQVRGEGVRGPRLRVRHFQENKSVHCYYVRVAHVERATVASRL